MGVRRRRTFAAIARTLAKRSRTTKKSIARRGRRTSRIRISLRRWLRNSHAEGFVRLGIMKLEGRPVAAQIWLVCGEGHNLQAGSSAGRRGGIARNVAHSMDDRDTCSRRCH